MKSLPPEARAYKRTPTFGQDNIPAGLLHRHSTRAGTWGRIVVLEGRLRYRILEPEFEEEILTPERPGIVEPQIEHEVALLGPVSFYVEFCRIE